MCCMCYSLYDERFVVLRPDSGWCWRTCLPSCVCGLEGDQGDCQSQGQLMWMKGRWDKHILIKITFSFHLLIHSFKQTRILCLIPVCSYFLCNKWVIELLLASVYFNGSLRNPKVIVNLSLFIHVYVTSQTFFQFLNLHVHMIYSFGKLWTGVDKFSLDFQTEGIHDKVRLFQCRYQSHWRNQ